MATEQQEEFGPGREFFTPWHRDAYLQGCEREIAGAQRRLQELRDTPADTAAQEAEAERQIANAKRELQRLTGQRGAAKRPAGAGRQARANG